MPASSTYPSRSAAAPAARRKGRAPDAKYGIAVSGHTTRSAPGRPAVSRAYRSRAPRRPASDHFSSCGTLPCTMSTRRGSPAGRVHLAWVSKAVMAAPPAHSRAAAPPAHATARGRAAPARAKHAAVAATARPTA